MEWRDIDQDISDNVVLRLWKLRNEILAEKVLMLEITQALDTHNIYNLLDYLDFYIYVLRDHSNESGITLAPFKGETYHKQMIISVLIDAAEKTRDRSSIEYRNGFMELFDRLNSINDAFLSAIEIIKRY